jgi:pimeloyl-ACP methyl ester carboxylesterase
MVQTPCRTCNTDKTRPKKELGDRVTLVEIPKAGHLVLVEQPQKVADEVVSFLRQR